MIEGICVHEVMLAGWAYLRYSGGALSSITSVACLAVKFIYVRVEKSVAPPNGGCIWYLTNLALAYALTGETGKAVTLVEQLLTTPTIGAGAVTPITLMQLKGWRWESLRSNSRFQKILAGPEPKTVF